MVVTEEQAKEMWCPMARLVSATGRATMGPLNRVIDARQDKANLNPIDARCLGSKCMMWRWYNDDLGRCGLAGPVYVAHESERACKP